MRLNMSTYQDSIYIIVSLPMTHKYYEWQIKSLKFSKILEY
jgi:hypothetical protein